MTVLYCLSHINKSLQWFWFADEMKRRGIKQIYVLLHKSRWGENYLVKDLKELGIETHFLVCDKRRSYLKHLLFTRYLIRKHKADIVHTSLPLGNLVGQLAAWICGIKNTVTTCENVSWAHDFQNRRQEWIDRFTFNQSKKIIATSDIAANYLRNNWNFNKSKLATIYHGLKPSDYEVDPRRVAKIREQLGIRENLGFIVGVVSRFEFWKGHEYIIEAARLLKNHPEIKIYIFGAKGSYFNEAMQKIKKYGLEEKVLYGGFLEDTPALYRIFDVHLHVPVNEYIETGGITIIEGMMASVPQILTRSGYAWQTAKHLENSWIVPFEDAEAIAEGIIWMKDNPEKARELALRAKKDAMLFSIPVKTKQHIELYKNLLP